MGPANEQKRNVLKPNPPLKCSIKMQIITIFKKPVVSTNISVFLAHSLSSYRCSLTKRFTHQNFLRIYCYIILKHCWRPKRLLFIEILALQVLRTLEQVSPRLLHAHESWNLQLVGIKTKENADHFQYTHQNVTKLVMLKVP
jgi:hypothetical protein